ncbi:type II toxin-antitoxin system mRNA interferase toxin, RelE/StbE family [Xenorhabdus beddingii]|nr:type II toxin-antitoxin system mRNA interferase toxin, RelE/StbE family [Xenorhabdus beddingii]
MVWTSFEVTGLRDWLESVGAALPILNPRQRDHDLSDNWSEYRECHIKPDLLLIYRKPDSNTFFDILPALKDGDPYSVQTGT